MPFLYPWTDTAGSPTFLSDFLAFHRSLRDTWRPDKWTLECGVWADGELMGVQGVNAANFHQQRVVATGSWLGQRFQGRGYGMEMRVAVLHLAFSGLGATAADTGVLEGNIASERVSAKLGYVRSGERTVAPRGKPVREQYFRLESTRWTQVERPPVEIVGLDECLPLFGVTT
jgi:RimJ/RimL family protein N-acetyltransferase